MTHLMKKSIIIKKEISGIYLKKMKTKALIVSIKGTRLTKLEKTLLSKEKPWGIILFKRNIKSLDQLKKLTNNIKFYTKNRKFPIIIDEEGKNVMYKFLNIFMILLICIFIFFIFKYYSSNKNLSNKNYNRLNIDQIINEKINNLPILDNDTNNVVEFNDSFDDEINNNKKRNFWDLFKKDEN